MVTGNNSIVTRGEFIDPAIEQLSSKEGELSIFQAGDGLSFSLAHQPTGRVVLLAEYELSSDPSAILELLKQFNEPFGSYKIGWKSQLNTWIPKALFDESKLSTYSESTLGKGKFDFTEMDEMDSILIHEPIPAQLERVVEAYPNPLALPDAGIHATAITRHWKTRPGEHVYIDYNNDALSVTAVSNGSLLLQNTYSIQSEEDALYYILFAYEQLKFNQDEVPMKVSGTLTENHGLWSTLSKYIRNIEWMEFTGNIHPSSAIPINELRVNAALIQLHSCG